MDWSWHVGRGWKGLRWSWRCFCCCKVALIKIGRLEVETGRVLICAVQEVNIDAQVSCEMQEVQRILSKAARGGLGSGPMSYISLPHQPLACLRSLNDLKALVYVTFRYIYS